MPEVPETETPDFDALYRADPDPWQVRSSAYEGRKLGILLASLTSPAYASAWDPGCGVGELAARLAQRCDLVLASDASPEAVRLTRERCTDLDNVTTAVVSLPLPPPTSGFDLVVLSEFLFYLDPTGRRQAMAIIDERCAPSAELASLHWRPKPHDAWLSGEAMQAEISADLGARGWTRHTHHDDRDFVLDIHRRPT
jgi:SAM-dependent methyltransferase